MYILIRNVMKTGEKQRTMLAQTRYSVLSAGCVCVCVCDVRLPNFALVILPGKLIMGDIIFLSKIKYFPDRPTRLSGPYITGTKQLFCHGLKSCKNPLRFLQRISAKIFLILL